MKTKQFILSVLMVMSLAGAGLAAEAQKVPAATNELDRPYTLTRKDWLELSLPRYLQNELSTWSQKTEYAVIIHDATQTIEVTLRCTNGSVTCKFYVQESSEALKNHLEDYLKRYDWARSLKVHITLE